MGDKDDYLTAYRVFFENFAATVNPEDQLPVHIAGYTITEAELAGEVIYWTTQYLTEKLCPHTLLTPLRRIILEEVKVASKKHPIEFGYVADESVYVALRLMQAVTARVNDVCLRYLDNSRLDSLPPPPPLALREYLTVSAATKNSRRVMEDRHIEIGNLEALFGIDTTEPTSFYAVYDGHAGSAAATYCAAHLHQYLVESPHFTTDLRRAMHEAFMRTDAEFVRKSNQERVYGGSTAVVVCVRARRLLAAWAGDSQALLAKRMRLMQLVSPHKPNREDERERIESSGGAVMHYGTWRVNGQLAVSRAIGDAQYKPYVTARPETDTVELDGDEDFVVVACDGLWDFVSEDEVALSVYTQLAADPDDLKAVAKRLIVQAKRQGSVDNISAIVVFLKNPRDIVADNYSPMDLGLDNAVVNAPPYAVDADACKASAAAKATGACADADADNGVSDSDSEDLGPETAVDIDADVELDRLDRDNADDNGLDQAAAPTPPAHAVEGSHVDGHLVDNVAESGEDSEDEWNYYKGEGDRDQNASEEADEPPRSETPCQDNSAWESSSVDMNSSPLNPEAPVFVPGTVAGSDTLLAESPRKPLPMDDIELPDVAQFNTEAVVRPAELLDLDNCDQLNGHHNISMEGVTEHLNGNEKCEMESLGFGFNVGIDSEKMKDTELIQDFERIQKDTTDFCNIQVFQTHTTSNPFATEADEELFERLKNKERDPMSMSFYQEKDDDTCERFGKMESHVDLNAVQPLPDSDDEDMQTNGVCNNSNDDDKENVSPEHEDLLGSDSNALEPNNDSIMFGDRSVPNNLDNMNSFMDFNITNSNNVQTFSNAEYECSNVSHENVAPTDTPESHKLLFEQIPEIPDGKSSELGFTNEDLQDPYESEKDTRVITPQDEIPQDFDMENKLDESPSEKMHPGTHDDILINQEQISSEKSEQVLPVESNHTDFNNENEIISECAQSPDIEKTDDQLVSSPEPEAVAEIQHTNQFTHNEIKENVVVDVHQNSEEQYDNNIDNRVEDTLHENKAVDTPVIKLETELITSHTPDIDAPKTPVPAEASLPQSPLPSESFIPADSSLPSESPLPTDSPLPGDVIVQDTSIVPSTSPIHLDYIGGHLETIVATTQSHSPLPTECYSQSPLPTGVESFNPLLPAEVPLPSESPIAGDSPLPDEVVCSEINPPVESSIIGQSPIPIESPLPVASPLPIESQVPNESQTPIESTLPAEALIPAESPLDADDVMEMPIESQPVPASPLPTDSHVPVDTVMGQSPAPAETPLPDEEEDQMPVESHIHSPFQQEERMESNDSIDRHIDVDVKAEAPASAETASTNLEIDFAAPTKSPITDERPSPVPVETESEVSVLRPETTSPRSSPMPEETTEATETTTTPAPIAVDESFDEIKATSQMTSETLKATDSVELVETSTGTLAMEGTAPAPDLVPDRRAELVTDIDIGIPESRAQEICVPVTNEIQHDDAVQPSATPPPTPAVEPAAPAPLSDTPIAADAVPAAAAAATVALAAGAAALGAAKAKTPAKKAAASPAAKTDRTPKTTPKPTPARTPASAKRPASAAVTPTAAKSVTTAAKSLTPVATRTPAARSASAKTPASNSKPATPRPTTATTAKTTPKAAPAAAKPAPRPAPAPAKEAPAASKAAPAARASARPAPARPAAPRPNAAKPAAAPAAKPAPRAPSARPAPISRPPASAPSRPAAAKPKEAKPKAPEKPVANGDVKAVSKAPPRAVPARAAPRPAPRAPAAAPASKPAAPKPATRVTLDKQSKDLANKRITAKAAPPRTAPVKGPQGPRSVTRPALANGDAPRKAPPSPPAPDNALLPDVIA